MKNGSFYSVHRACELLERNIWWNTSFSTNLMVQLKPAVSLRIRVQEEPITDPRSKQKTVHGIRYAANPIRRYFLRFRSPLLSVRATKEAFLGPRDRLRCGRAVMTWIKLVSSSRTTVRNRVSWWPTVRRNITLGILRRRSSYELLH